MHSVIGQRFLKRLRNCCTARRGWHGKRKETVESSMGERKEAVPDSDGTEPVRCADSYGGYRGDWCRHRCPGDRTRQEKGISGYPVLCAGAYGDFFGKGAVDMAEEQGGKEVHQCCPVQICQAILGGGFPLHPDR